MIIETRGIKIINIGKYFQTDGLDMFVGHEIKLLFKNRTQSEYLKVLTYLVEYIVDEQTEIKNEETISYHSWLLKFVLSLDGKFNLHEIDKNGEIFNEGVDYALEVVSEQEIICKKFHVQPLFPLFNQKIVISVGVYEGLDVEAVRYPSPDHMTGWWLTTELYNGNTDSLNVVHYYHLAFSRPDIIKYLALPFGYRFIKDKEYDIWFDDNVLSDL